MLRALPSSSAMRKERTWTQKLPQKLLCQSVAMLPSSPGLERHLIKVLSLLLVEPSAA